MEMTKTTIGFGTALIVLGLLGYLLTGGASATALIPALFGLVLAILGFIAFKDIARKHVMHGAAAFGLLGVVATLPRLLGNLGSALSGEAISISATLSLLLMFVLCAVYVGLCVRSFIMARRAGSV
jgi:hypothetical protein